MVLILFRNRSNLLIWKYTSVHEHCTFNLPKVIALFLSSWNPGEIIHILDFNVGKVLNNLDFEIREISHKLPLTALVWKILNLLNFNVGKVLNNLYFQVWKVIDYLHLARKIDSFGKASSCVARISCLSCPEWKKQYWERNSKKPIE